MNNKINIKTWESKRKITGILHIIIFFLCLALISMLSLEIFKDLSETRRALLTKVQFWICIIFIVDFFVELFISDQKWEYFKHHFIFLIVSIPYISIIQYTGVHFDTEASYYDF